MLCGPVIGRATEIERLTDTDREVLRLVATGAAVLLLPPFLVLAVAPMLLVLAPIALLGIPVLIGAHDDRATECSSIRSIALRSWLRAASSAAP